MLLARMQVNHWVILGQLILVLPMLLMLLAPNPQGLLVLAGGRVRPETTEPIIWGVHYKAKPWLNIEQNLG